MVRSNSETPVPEAVGRRSGLGLRLRLEVGHNPTVEGVFCRVDGEEQMVTAAGGGRGVGKAAVSVGWVWLLHCADQAWD